MPSKNPTTSLRLPPPIAHLVKLHAEEHKLAYHAALVRLVKIGLERGALPVNTPQMSAKIGQLKPTPKPRARWSLDVPVGPVEQKPGSRLKTKAKK
jgi:hypothetical protein